MSSRPTGATTWGAGFLAVGLLAVLVAAAVFSMTRSDTEAPEPREAPVPTEPRAVPVAKRVVFTRPAEPSPAPAPPPSVEPADPPTEPHPPTALTDLPHDERATLQKVARIALGQTMVECEQHVPEGLMAIAVVTLDERGLQEMAPIDPSGQPLDAPALARCLDDTLWSQDWPATSGPLVRFGLQLQGPAPLE